MPPRKTKTAKQSGAKLKKDSAATAKKFEVRVKVTVVDDAITSVVRSATRVVIDATPTPDATRAKDTPKDDMKQEESESPSVEQIIDAEADLHRKGGGEVKVTRQRVNGVRNKKLHDTKISDYYPIRRSSRRTEAELKKEIDENFQHCIESKEQQSLKVKEFVGKGRGVIAIRPFTRNEFVVEYAGDLIDVTAAKVRESEYLATKSGCYMYYFNHKNKNYCIDATAESPYFGRLVNHSRVKPNCHTKVVEVRGQPHLVLLASRRIEAGEELLYDYGDRSKESLEAYPWLAL